MNDAPTTLCCSLLGAEQTHTHGRYSGCANEFNYITNKRARCESRAMQPTNALSAQRETLHKLLIVIIERIERQHRTATAEITSSIIRSITSSVASHHQHAHTHTHTLRFVNTSDTFTSAVTVTAVSSWPGDWMRTAWHNCRCASDAFDVNPAGVGTIVWTHHFGPNVDGQIK